MVVSVIDLLYFHTIGLPGRDARFPVRTMFPIQRRAIRKSLLRVRLYSFFNCLSSTFLTMKFGLANRWVPYTRAPNKCELNCMPKGERFYYRHRRKVIDGTRCDEQEGTDVCVSGQCLVSYVYLNLFF